MIQASGSQLLLRKAVAIAKIVIAGAGVVGLGAGLLLCRDGHEVTVLERDAEGAPAGAAEIWDTWQRKGVSQFRLPHFFLARYRALLDSELPQVKNGLTAAGAVRGNPVLDAPEAIRGSAREGDDAFECGFIYYGRHFRSAGGGVPPALGGLLMHLGSISALTLPADNGTWSVTLVTSAKDKALRRLRDAATWEKAVRSLPLVAHWLDGQPIDDRVAAMAGIEDRHRNLMVDGAPVATGVVAAGDAWACSNPTVGRGASIGMLQAVLLRDTIAAAGLDDPWEFACSFHHATAEIIEPWYRDTLAADRHRLAEIDALIGGEEYRPRDPGWEIGQALANAAFKDPDCLRGFASVAMVLSRAADVVVRPGLLDKVIALGSGWRDEPLPAPSRAGLLSIVAGD